MLHWMTQSRPPHPPHSYGYRVRKGVKVGEEVRGREGVRKEDEMEGESEGGSDVRGEEGRKER